MKEKMILALMAALSLLLMLLAGTIYSYGVMFLVARLALHPAVYAGIGIAAVLISFGVYSLLEAAVLHGTTITQRAFAAACVLLPAALFLLWLSLCRFAGVGGHLPAACGTVMSSSLLLALCLRDLFRHLRAGRRT